jgi:hypothetical protein
LFDDYGENWGFYSNEKLKSYHKAIYGSSYFDPDIFGSAFIQYHDFVNQTFKKKDNLLVLNLWSDKNPWEALCDKLGVNTPKFSYPKTNDGYPSWLENLKFEIYSKYYRILNN